MEHNRLTFENDLAVLSFSIDKCLADTLFRLHVKSGISPADIGKYALKRYLVHLGKQEVPNGANPHY